MVPPGIVTSFLSSPVVVVSPPLCFPGVCWVPCLCALFRGAPFLWGWWARVSRFCGFGLVVCGGLVLHINVVCGVFCGLGFYGGGRFCGGFFVMV